VFSLVERVKEIALKEKVDAIIFQDYNKGILTKKVIEDLITFANDKGIPTAVDPKKENFLAYKNVSLFKPNLKELKEGLDVKFEYNNEDKSEFLKAIELLKKEINPTNTFITLSEHGVYISDDQNHHFIPAHLRNITDVSGAGDTVISVAALCLASGLSPKYIAEVSNLAGGLVCEKVGVISIDKTQLIKEALNI
jgi:rfaE bifunctional protein kinase chain/domain